MLAGATACLCFVVPQLLVMLHLVLDEHCSVSAVEQHHAHAERAHAPDRHGHGHEFSGQDPSEEEHPSHPAEEDLAQLEELAVARTSVQPAAAPVSSASAPLIFDLPSPERPRFEAIGPRPPPPRAAAAPRAPPLVV